MYNYSAFKFPVRSELLFPELMPALESTHPEADQITIKFGEVNPLGLPLAKYKGLYFQTTEFELWLNIPTIARFLISNGKQIIIDPVAGIDEESIRLFVLGSCMGALLMQRNLLLLHGNAIKTGEHCISFVGHSGIGKSTLSGAFYKRGYSILADDVCAINAQGSVLPGFPQIKLWFDAAKQLGIATEGLRKIRPRIEKFAVPLAHQFHAETLPLKVVYILNSHNKDEFKFELVAGMQKLQPLQNHTYRKTYLNGLGKDKRHFSQCAKIASQIAIVRVTRPNEGFKLDELVDLIEQDLQGRNLSHA